MDGWTHTHRDGSLRSEEVHLMNEQQSLGQGPRLDCTLGILSHCGRRDSVARKHHSLFSSSWYSHYLLLFQKCPGLSDQWGVYPTSFCGEVVIESSLVT